MILMLLTVARLPGAGGLIRIITSLFSLAALKYKRRRTKTGYNFPVWVRWPATWVWNHISEIQYQQDVMLKLHKLKVNIRRKAFDIFYVLVICPADRFYNVEFNCVETHIAIAHLPSVEEPKTCPECPPNVPEKKNQASDSSTHTKV